MSAKVFSNIAKMKATHINWDATSAAGEYRGLLRDSCLCTQLLYAYANENKSAFGWKPFNKV